MAWQFGFRILGRSVGRSGIARGLAGVAGASTQVPNQQQPNLTVRAVVDATAALKANNIRLQRLANMRPVWDYIADDFAKKQKTVFSKGGAVSGFSAWAPLKPNTIERKNNSNFKRNANRILVRSGQLRSSLTNRSHPNFVFRATSKSMQIGTNVRYASVHDKGSFSSGIPRRSLIRIPDDVLRKWNSRILRHLVSTDSLGFERLD